MTDLTTFTLADLDAFAEHVATVEAENERLEALVVELQAKVRDLEFLTGWRHEAGRPFAKQRDAVEVAD